MRTQHISSKTWMTSALLIVLILAGCSGKAAAPATTAPTAAASAATTAATEAASTTPTAAAAPAKDKNVLFQDDFTNPASGWPDEKFDNYFVGYHEPEFYHVEVSSANYKTTVFEPDKQIFEDATITAKAFTVAKKTAATGDFNYGIAFRRSGDQYYAFTISPRTKKWYVLKSSPTALTTLKEGTETTIHDLGTADILRVDAKGSNFTFYINDKLVSQITDKDYAKGETGLYVQTFDATNVHVHFDSLSVRKVEAAQTLALTSALIYKDDFTNPVSGWSEKKFDNYFIGYHEPEFYHVEVSSPNYKTTVFEPNKTSFGDFTMEVKVFTVSKKTAATGDFAYGTAFRRSGDEYYAFTISPRTKKWTLLKSSPSALTVLAEGTEASISNPDTADILRVDAQGSKIFLHINDQFVGQVTDKDYAAGEVGMFVQTFDATNVHVHFDSIAVNDFIAPQICTVNALTLNIRSGPGTSFGSTNHLSKGDIAIPAGRTEDGTWIKIRLANSGDSGWVFNKQEFLSCSSEVQLLPVTNP